MSEVNYFMDAKPITVSRTPHLRPDGQFVSVTLTQGDATIELTPEQIGSLIAALSVYKPQSGTDAADSRNKEG